MTAVTRFKSLPIHDSNGYEKLVESLFCYQLSAKEATARERLVRELFDRFEGVVGITDLVVRFATLDACRATGAAQASEQQDR